MEGEPETIERPILFNREGLLYAVSDTGGEPVLVSQNDTLAITYSEWSPLGNYIIYQVRISSSENALFVTDRRDWSPVRVTPPGLRPSPYVSWSPDERRIAFSAGALELYVVDRDGTNVVALTGDGTSGRFPHWAPNGEWIVVYGVGPDGVGVRRIRPDGSANELVRETRVPIDLGGPRYSPDGSRIVFQDEQDLYVMDADGGNVEALTFTPLNGDWWPRWSPDGTRIAFHVDGGAHWAIGVIDVRLKIITDTLGNPNRDNYFPSWAPDGQRLTYGFTSVGVARVGDSSYQVVASGQYPSWHLGR